MTLGRLTITAELCHCQDRPGADEDESSMAAGAIPATYKSSDIADRLSLPTKKESRCTRQGTQLPPGLQRPAKK
jgi:hypothetical protein